uniref:Uncharacterized protein n=1 Tax=Pararge aegeria TaxID=116150 RepID=S4PX47_9NEOP
MVTSSRVLSLNSPLIYFLRYRARLHMYDFYVVYAIEQLLLSSQSTTCTSLILQSQPCLRPACVKLSRLNFRYQLL